MDAALDEESAAAYIGGVCFSAGPPRRVGVELEWLVRDRARPGRPAGSRRLRAALAPFRDAPLPAGGRLTWEPGGQLELSSPPGESLAECVALAAADLAELRSRVHSCGALLYGRGLDPCRMPARVLHEPRYRAMEAHFDRRGSWGRTMMRATAAVQISLDAGDDSDGFCGYRRRWLLAHRLGPVLVAAFANSPLWRSRPTGWRSTRQWIWARADPCRTRPPQLSGDARANWARYALDADVLCVRRDPPADWSAPPRLTFRSWLRGVEGLRPPTREDLDYHLSTLFPPVRPRGWMELRMIDAQHGDGWIAATAVAATLLDDPRAAAAAWEATEPLARATGPGAGGAAEGRLWLRAARDGPSDPLLGPAVRACVAAAEEALARTGRGGAAHRAVAEFAERYSERGRCPADDRLGGSGGPEHLDGPVERLRT